MSQQLVKKGANGGMVNVNPKSWIEAIKDKNTGQPLVEILQGFNMYFLPYNGNTSATRCLVPTMLRKKGLWITYVKYDGNVYTEWYATDELDDKSWGDSSNWRVGNNTLVGDITISANGNWVINGTETEFKAVGEKGNTPLLRVANNRLQVSYDLGDTYIDVTNNPVYTKFRWLATSGDTQANNVGRIQASTDEGKTWTNMSNDFTNNLHISRYIGVNESLPTSGIAEGTIYAKGPYYAEDDTLNDNPIYRLWVYAWKGNTLAWQDNGEFQSIAAGVVQETGNSETEVMSQKATTEKLTELATQVIYDVSANNGGATFSSLSALLSSENLSTLIPSTVRCGGMSIRFVQSSDNKYVQYRLMDDEWSTDIEFWAIYSESAYVENPEFVYVKTDAKGKILWAIKIDGGIYYGSGCPQQVKDYIGEIISSLSLDEYEDIAVFLADYLGSDTTLKTLLDSKLDAEGLDTDALATVLAVENPEYIQATIDNEGKMVEGITSGGVKQINLPVDTPSVTIEYAENPEFINVTTDNEGKILEGFSTEGKKIVNVETLFNKVNSKTFETDHLKISENGREEFRKDFANAKFVIQNLPEIAKFSVDDILKDFSTEINEMPLSTNLFTILYEQMDILMQTYPEFITKVDLFEFVENEMNALGVTDYPFYANGINEEIENEYTFPDGSTTTFTYEITPAYKTYMYVIDFSNDWWANDNFNNHKNILLIGGTHGSEKQSIINLYLFTKLLCSGTIDKNYFALRNSCKFYIVPMLSGYSVLHELRNNANGININRNFPCKNGFVVSKGEGVDSKGYYYNYTGPEAYSEFETKLVKCLAEKIKPQVAIDHHSYGFELDCQLYYDVVPNTEVARCYYQASIDISHALQKAYPEYFGTNGKLLINSNSYLGPRDGNDSQTMGVWFYNIMGIRFSSTIEVSHFLNYENGEPISRAPIYDAAYRKKVFAVSEYTLRVSLIRLLERLFVVNN